MSSKIYKTNDITILAKHYISIIRPLQGRMTVLTGCYKYCNPKGCRGRASGFIKRIFIKKFNKRCQRHKL